MLNRALFFCSILILAAFPALAEDMQLAGGSCSSCAGDENRAPLYDLAVKGFTALLAIDQKQPIYVSKLDPQTGKTVQFRVPVLDLYSKFVDAVQNNNRQIRMVHSRHGDKCLKDDSGTCVEFLSDPNTHQMTVDVDLLKEQDKPLDDPKRLHSLMRLMFHEALRLAGKDDWMYQYSGQLASLADGSFHNTPQSPQPVQNQVSGDLSPGWHDKVISSKIITVGDCQCYSSCGLFGRSSYQLNWIEKQQVLKYLVDASGSVVSSYTTNADVNQQNLFSAVDWSPSSDERGLCDANKNTLTMQQSAQTGDVTGTVQSLNQIIQKDNPPGSLPDQAVSNAQPPRVISGAAPASEPIVLQAGAGR
jgi:hypothetical protein